MKILGITIRPKSANHGNKAQKFLARDKSIISILPAPVNSGEGQSIILAGKKVLALVKLPRDFTGSDFQINKLKRLKKYL